MSTFVCRTFVFRWSWSVMAEADAVPPVDAADLLAAQPALGEAHPEAALLLDGLAVGLAPFLVGGVEVVCEGHGVGAEEATLLQERCQHVHLGAISAGCLSYFFGGLEASSAPLEAALYDPGKDARQLAAQFVGELFVLLLWRDGDNPGDEADAAPDGCVGAPDLRFVVGREPQLVGGGEVEPLGLHEPGGYGVLAGEVLYPRLRQAASLLRL